MKSATVTLGVPCRADEPDLGGTLETLLAAWRRAGLTSGPSAEMVICINGMRGDDDCPPRVAAREVCAGWGLPVSEVWLPAKTRRPQGGFCCTVLLTAQAGKPRAWRAIWAWAAEAVAVVFCDADVRVDPDAVAHLLARRELDSHLGLVAATEVPRVGAQPTLWTRIGAIPYRFDFGNAGGRLYLLRKDALAVDMPEDLLLEDAWLTVAVGRSRVAKEPRARVRFLPPATWKDYFAERVRTEGGKIQIRGLCRPRAGGEPVARYRLADFWHGIAFREYPLVALGLGVRALARLWARVLLARRDFYSLYRPFGSTKGWASS